MPSTGMNADVRVLAKSFLLIRLALTEIISFFFLELLIEDLLAYLLSLSISSTRVSGLSTSLTA
ncbi:MAG: hypothetical protein QXJ51_00995 [Sulfolobales archaeon]